MRIDPRWVAGSLAPGTSKAAAAPGRPVFRLAAERAAGGSAARAAAPLATMGAILALQEDDRGGGERRRRSARHGQNLLEALDGLKAALLSGTVPIGELGRLSAAVTAGAAASGDPTLDGIVAAIELRAKVELAKLGSV